MGVTPDASETTGRVLAGKESLLPQAPASRMRTIEDWFCAILMSVFIGAGLISVLKRFVVRMPVIGKLAASDMMSWPDPLAKHLVLWVALFGAGAAAADHSHIAIDALIYILPERGRRFVGLFTNLITIIICLIFTWLAFGFARGEFANSTGELTFFGLQTSWLSGILPIGFALLALRSLVVLVADAKALARKTGSTTNPPKDGSHAREEEPAR
jgi:TRAP-type transport system small permease protein